MKVSIAYVNAEQKLWQTLEIAEGSTVADVISISGIESSNAIDLKRQKVGIFGKITRLDAPVQEGDRVEIYQPITRVLDEDDDDDDDDD